MGALFDKIAEWLKEILVDASMGNLTDLFQSVNDQVQSVAGQVGTSPANFSPSIFAMIRNISESVILPIAGVILTFIACYELIQLVTDHNNLAQLDTWIILNGSSRHPGKGKLHSGGTVPDICDWLQHILCCHRKLPQPGHPSGRGRGLHRAVSPDRRFAWGD